MRKLKFVGLFFLTIAFLSVNPIFSQTLDDLITSKSPDEIRVLKILIAADFGFRKQVLTWRGEITTFINTASLSLEKQVGIKLEIVGFVNWKRDTKGSQSNWYWAMPYELIKDFPRKENSDFDIVIGLTSHYLEGTSWSQAEEGYILITDKEKKNSLDDIGDVKTTSYPLLSALERQKKIPSLILHELGHLFDCRHREDESVMVVENSTYSLWFSKEDIETIKKNKWRKFPIAPEKNS